MLPAGLLILGAYLCTQEYDTELLKGLNFAFKLLYYALQQELERVRSCACRCMNSWQKLPVLTVLERPESSVLLTCPALKCISSFLGWHTLQFIMLHVSAGLKLFRVQSGMQQPDVAVLIASGSAYWKANKNGALSPVEVTQCDGPLESVVLRLNMTAYLQVCARPLPDISTMKVLHFTPVVC